MSRLELWLIMLLMGLVTLALRGSFLLWDRIALPAGLARVLRFVPAAVLAALAAPALLLDAEGGLVSPLDARFLAGVLAALVAWRTRNIPLTLAVGMAALWTLRALL